MAATTPAVGKSAGGPDPASDERALTRRRRRALALIGLSVLTAVIAAAGWWWEVARWQTTTSDAYVGADMAQISALAAGTVRVLAVQTGQQVKEGDLLAELDDTDGRLALATAEAQLAKAVRVVRGLSGTALAAEAVVSQRRSDVAAAEARLQAAGTVLLKARSELARQTGLAERRFLSPEALVASRAAVATAQADRDAAESAVRVAQAGTGQARAQARAAGVQIEDGPLSRQPDVALAAAAVRQAMVVLARTRILAPIDGVAGPRSAQIGERVAPGSPIVSLIPLGSVWVDANFKETELASLRVGQPATLIADAYGSAVAYRGKVAGIAPATGSALSLLPAQNATGNWIKVVQRVPVRIWLETAELASHPLQVGLSMNVTVDLRDKRGPRLGVLPQAAGVQRTAIYDDAAREAEARVAAIIAANAGR